MPRGRKPNKIIRIEMEMEMPDAEIKRFKDELKSLILANYDGKLMYLAMDTEAKRHV